MRRDNRFEDIDRAALHNALLALHTCPNCRNALLPVAYFDDVWGCKECAETWQLAVEEKSTVPPLVYTQEELDRHLPPEGKEI